MCSLALAAFGGNMAPALAQTANVTAFNPYSNAGLSGTQPPRGGGYEAPNLPSAGPAFNPWQPGGVTAGWGTSAPAPALNYGGTTPSVRSDLPPPPPGPIQSRLIAVPQRGDGPGAPRVASAPPTPAVTPPPPVATPAPPAPAPVVTQRETPPSAATPSMPAPPPARVAAAAPPPPPPEPVTPPATVAPPIATLAFAPRSGELSDATRSELDRVIKTSSGTKQFEVRAYAGGSDPAESRKIALARALAVRSYLIDQGVKARIEVGAYASTSNGSSSERVEILTPNR